MILLANDFKKWLTEEVLNECYHELVMYKQGDWYTHYDNYKCVKRRCKYENTTGHFEGRTFIDSWKDLGDVILAAQKMGWWDKFLWSLWKPVLNSVGTTPINTAFILVSLPVIYINPETFFPELQVWWEANVKEKKC